ncbi:hypothetical protein [Streptomyces sp. CLCI03]
MISTHPNQFTRSDAEDIAKMERLLDLQEGVLAREVRDFHLERIVCECERVLTVYDFVLTALIDAGHSKGLIIQTMLGNKLVLNTPRPIRCSNCSRINRAGDYTMPNYACCPTVETADAPAHVDKSADPAQTTPAQEK